MTTTTPNTVSPLTDPEGLASLFWARVEASELIHHYLGYGWSFEWDNAKRRRGATHFNTKTITMSKHLTPIRTRAAVRNTILHEIAHALVGPSHGHDRVWRAKAISIGCNGERCTSDTAQVAHNWELICNSCGKVVATRLRRSDTSNKVSRCHRSALAWRQA